MSSSDITVAALTVTPTLRGNKCAWTYSDPRSNALPNIGLDMVEVWSSTTNDRTTATKVGEGITDFPHDGLVEEQTYYYWIKARDYLGTFGAWYPSGSTSGIGATAIGMSGLTLGLANGKLVASVTSNAATVAVKTAAGNDPSAADPVFVAFRNVSLAVGSYIIRCITAALSVTLPNGATAGFVSLRPGRLWGALIDVGDGTVKIGLQNCSTASAIFGLPEYGLVTTVLNDTGADSAGVMYADAVVTGRPFRIAGFFDWNSGLATAGAWSAGPDIIQMFGPGIKKPGDTVQVSLSIDAAFGQSASGYGIPFDDTIPQSSEGFQIFSTSITPSSKCNLIENFVEMNAGCNGGNIMIQTLFQDSGADAIAVATTYLSNAMASFQLYDLRQPGTVSSTAYKVRLGAVSTTGSIFKNGLAAARVFGGGMSSIHRVTEVMG
jgi:hypothetical protein